MLTGTRIVTARIVWNFDPTLAPPACIDLKCELTGIWRYCTMTVTIAFAPAARWWRSLEYLAVGVSLFRTCLAAEKAGTAESISSANPRARPQAALNAGELSGRSLRPLVICDLSLMFISVCWRRFEWTHITSFVAWPLMGNREANRNMAKSIMHNDLHGEIVLTQRDKLS